MLSNKKKVFFIISSLDAGGSERVFWILSQSFDNAQYQVSIVLLDRKNGFFTRDVQNVKFIDLNSGKASRSFFPLYKLLKREKPEIVFSTTDHINILVALVSLFVKIPKLIARSSNIPKQMRQYEGFKDRFWNHFLQYSYRRFDKVVCQTEEMKEALISSFRLRKNKLPVIGNPVLHTQFVNNLQSVQEIRKLIIVARLSSEKGHARLLNIIKELPTNYTLSIVGDGVLRNQLEARTKELNLGHRVKFMGQQQNVNELIAGHNLLVLTSYTEGFPNVVLESLSVGTPVVAFRVGGLEGLLIDGFNGYIVEQDDYDTFKKRIQSTCDTIWNKEAIIQQVYKTNSSSEIAFQYQQIAG